MAGPDGEEALAWASAEASALAGEEVLAEVLAEASALAGVGALADGGRPHPIPVTMGRPLPTWDMVTPIIAPPERLTTRPIEHILSIRGSCGHRERR